MKDPRILLRRGDIVHIVEKDCDDEIDRAGPAGFTVKLSSHVRMFLWEDRGKTWRSALLDRKDAERNRFRRVTRGVRDDELDFTGSAEGETPK